MNVYIAGDVVQFKGTFTSNQVPIDPTTVVFGYVIFTQGSYVQTTYQTIYGAGGSPIVRTGVGLFYANIDTTALPGVWEYIWSSQGVGQCTAPPSTIQVNAPLFTPVF